MLPRIEPTIEALTTSCSPAVRAKKAMISSGRVAEGHVEQSADAGPGPGRQLLGGLAHQRRGRDHAERRGAEDQRRRRVSQLERDRHRDEDRERVDRAERAARLSGRPRSSSSSRSLSSRRRRGSVVLGSSSASSSPRQRRRRAAPCRGRRRRGKWAWNSSSCSSRLDSSIGTSSVDQDPVGALELLHVEDLVVERLASRRPRPGPRSGG